MATISTIEQAQTQIVAYLMTKSNKVGVRESEVIDRGIAGLHMAYRECEDLIDEMSKKNIIETCVYDGNVLIRGLKG